MFNIPIDGEKLHLTRPDLQETKPSSYEYGGRNCGGFRVKKVGVEVVEDKCNLVSPACVTPRTGALKRQQRKSKRASNRRKAAAGPGSLQEKKGRKRTGRYATHESAGRKSRETR